MAWRKQQEPAVPGWVGHAGFNVSDWAEASDFAAAPRVAESLAWRRWAEARSAFLRANPDVFDALMAELQSWCEDADS